MHGQGFFIKLFDLIKKEKLILNLYFRVLRMFNHIRKDFNRVGIFLLVIQHQSFGIKKNAIDSTVAFMRLEIPIGFGIAYIPNSVILVHFSRQDKGVEYFAGLKL